MTNNTTPRVESKSWEAAGWLSMIGILLMFPTLFFLCVYIPIWIGMASRW